MKIQNVGQNVLDNGPHRVGPGWFIRLLYFAFVGWWFSGVCIVVSFLLIATVVGMPIGVAILNLLPQITSLRPRSQGMTVTSRGDTTVINFQVGATQRNWFVRAAYFFLAGWWITALYLVVAWIGTVLTLGWGAFFLYYPVPALLTLHRN